MIDVDNASKQQLRGEVERLHEALQASRDANDELRKRLTAAPVSPAVLHAVPDGLLLLDAHAGTIRFANARAGRLLGRSDPSELQGATLSQVVADDERSRLMQQWAADGAEETPAFSEYRFPAAPAQRLALAFVHLPNDPSQTLAVLRDRATQHQLAETLAETLNLFDTAFHLGPAALMIVEMKTGAIMEVSDRLTELTGYTAHQLVGQRIADVEGGLPATERLRLVAHLQQEGSFQDYELVLPCKTGAPRTVLCSARQAELNGVSCALIGFADVTARKEATAALRESRDLFQKVFRTSPAPVGICRLADGQYLDVNDAMCTALGYSRSELTHTPADELGLWADPSRRETLKNRLAEESAVRDFEAQFRTAAGDTVTMLCSFQRIRLRDEPCVLTVMTDITRRTEARAALVEAKEKAEEVARFRSAVLSNMTHEMRTPLTVILGFTSMLREGVPDKYRRFIRLIERSGRRLHLTLDSLLDLAQLEADALDLSLKTHAVSEAVHGLTESLVHMVEAQGLDFTLETPDERVYARLDYELFGRVLHHLVDNAVKFTSEGEVAICVDATADTVSIEVTDTGCGIDASFLPRIFDAFSQESEGLARTHQGSGLGLTVSKRLVEKMNGTLEIDSVQGRGTTIRVLLPRVARVT
ncbi:sensor histidine kinase [Salisaeta longa]|uniref:sensor histidine kinase n=1 Tax=Salisaeta longa TaxID=503170 RepID=UPI0003B727F1|nr:PAS domain S-box protein [Salisaeta longa]